MRQHGATQDDIEKHRRMLADAQKDAEARRAHADKARRHAEGLPGSASAIPYSSMQHPLCVRGYQLLTHRFRRIPPAAATCLLLSHLEACACCH